MHTGKTTECGCYGGYVQPSIGQSLALNAVYGLLIVTAWFDLTGDSGYSFVLGSVPIVALVATAAFTEIGQRHARKHGKPLIDLNPLKVGKRWRHSWAGGLTTQVEGEVIVAFLGLHCPYCGQFVRVGNAMVQSSQLPHVVGVVAASKDNLDSFIEEKGIRFPIGTVSQSVVNRLVTAVPTAVLLEGGIINRVWVGQIPADIVDRIKDAFFPTVATASERYISGGSVSND